MTALRRLGRITLHAFAWPFLAIGRATPDGKMFLGLIVACGLLSSIGVHRWSNIPLLMCLFLLALWLLAMVQGSRSLRGIQLRRSHHDRVFAGEAMTVNLRVTNSSRLPSGGLTISEDVEFEPDLSLEKTGAAAARRTAARPEAFVLAVPGSGEARAQYGLSIQRRGIYQFGSTRIETVFPCGFFRSISTRSAPGRLVVYPRLGDVDTGFLEELELSLQSIRRAYPSRAEEEFRGLREYRHGDNPRRIHWKSSARAQALLLKEYEEPLSKRVTIILDTHTQRLGVQRSAPFELAISFAASVARELVRRGCEVECIALQPRNRCIRTGLNPERRSLEPLLETLAGLKRDNTQTLPMLCDRIGRQNLHRACVLVLGLGSLRDPNALKWLQTQDNVVRVIDARRGLLNQIFRAGSTTLREEYDEEEEA